MFKKTPITRAALLAIGGVLGFTALPTFAQSAERIEITGSLIRRIEGESALPVTTLKADDLAKAGVTNAEEAVKFITQQQGGTVTSSSVSGTNGAAAYADLRSLGQQRTLVLLNGRRVTSNPFAVTAVDLNTLPLAAVDRIEVLSDGASSTYGTDAVAGVINFITKKDYAGFAVSADAQITQHGGGDKYNGSIAGGFGDLRKQGWNVYGTLNMRKQDPMRGTEREFMQTSYMPEKGFNGLSPTTFPANYSQTVGGVTRIANTNPSLPGCLPPSSIIASAVATNRCNADTQTFTNVVPEQEQASAFLRGSLALGDHLLSAEYFKSQNKVTSLIAPSPEGGLTMGPDSPYYPGNGITPITNTALDPTQPISIAWRTTVLGSRSGRQENNTQRAVVSLEGALGGWDYQTAVLWSNAKVENFFLNGYPMTIPLRNGVRGINGAPYLNPFGEQSAAGLAYMQANQVLGKVQDGESTLTSLQATVSRPLFKLGGGDATLAIGAEARKEEMVYNTDIAKVSQAASSGLAGSGAKREGDRDISALALEMNFPLMKGLELGASVRYDHYSDFGNTTNPKLSLRWMPTSSLLVRASANTGFSAPSLYQMYLPNSTTFTGNRYNDPVLCPGGVPAAGAVPSRDCGIQFQQLQGGNANLEPEKSRAWTVGFVVQPTANLSVGVDAWNYYIKSSVSTIGEQSIFADPVKYANLFVRCSQASPERQLAIGACQTPGGDPLAYVINTFLNLGDVKTNGYDISATWNSGAQSWGRLGVAYNGTYVNKYRFQVEPGGVWYNPNGVYSPQFGGPVIRYQHVLNTTWQAGAFSTLLTYKFQKGYRDQNAQGAPFTAFNNRQVQDYGVFDLSVTWTGIKGLSLSAGVLNLLDTDPPFTNQVARFQARGYDDRFHNPLGRTWKLSARYSF